MTSLTDIVDFFAGMPSVGESRGSGLADYLDDSDYSYPSDDDYVYPSDGDDYTNEHEKVVHFTPTFTSTGTNQLVNEGDTIKLPCLVDKLGKFFSLVQP